MQNLRENGFILMPTCSQKPSLLGEQSECAPQGCSKLPAKRQQLAGFERIDCVLLKEFSWLYMVVYGAAESAEDIKPSEAHNSCRIDQTAPEFAFACGHL